MTRFLSFFDQLPPCADIFYVITVNEKSVRVVNGKRAGWAVAHLDFGRIVRTAFLLAKPFLGSY